VRPPELAALPPNAGHATTAPAVKGGNMNDDAKQMPETTDLYELLLLLMRLFERVQRLPLGPERSAALEQIRDFQLRLGTILKSRARG
jgi:hypothetical protein